MRDIEQRIYSKLLDTELCPGQLSASLSIAVNDVLRALDSLEQKKLVGVEDDTDEDVEELRKSWHLVRRFG